MVFSALVAYLGFKQIQLTKDQIATNAIQSVIAWYGTNGISPTFSTVLRHSPEPSLSDYVFFEDFSVSINQNNRISSFDWSTHHHPKIRTYRLDTPISAATISSRVLAFLPLLGVTEIYEVYGSTYNAAFVQAQPAKSVVPCQLKLRPMFGSYPYDVDEFGCDVIADPFLGVPVEVAFIGDSLPTPPAPPSQMVPLAQAEFEAFSQSNIKYGDQSILLRRPVEIAIGHPPKAGSPFSGVNTNAPLKYFYRVECWNSQGQECFYIDSVTGITSYSQIGGNGFGSGTSEPKRFTIGETIQIKTGKSWKQHKISAFRLTKEKPANSRSIPGVQGKLFSGVGLATSERNVVYFPYMGGYVKFKYR